MISMLHFQWAEEMCIPVQCEHLLSSSDYVVNKTHQLSANLTSLFTSLPVIGWNECWWAEETSQLHIGHVVKINNKRICSWLQQFTVSFWLSSDFRIVQNALLNQKKLINRLKQKFISTIPNIFQSVTNCDLSFISRSFRDLQPQGGKLPYPVWAIYQEREPPWKFVRLTVQKADAVSNLSVKTALV